MALTPPIIAPAFGQLGLPAGQKETGQRSDFRTEVFGLNISAHGYRLAWTRATICPCMPINAQTQQADPSCDLCQGNGFFYFGPSGSKQSAKLIGQLNDVQASIIEDNNAFVIRGLMTSLSRSVQPYDKIGTWVDGRSSVTVVPENRLGYLDRLVALDGFAVYTEKLLALDPALPLRTRYPINGGVNFLASTLRRYHPIADFTLEKGKVVWLDPSLAPPLGTPLTIHYVYNVTWLVTSQPHVVRAQNVNAKQSNPQTPEGNYVELALQAEVQLEHLIGENVTRNFLL
jgi:hypothetical protein